MRQLSDAKGIFLSNTVPDCFFEWTSFVELLSIAQCPQTTVLLNKLKILYLKLALVKCESAFETNDFIDVANEII